MAVWSPDEVRGDGFPRPRLARYILLVVLTGYTVTGITNILIEKQGSGNVPVSIGCMGVVFAIQILHSSRRALRWPPALKAATLGTQAVFTYLPLMLYSQFWGGMGGFLGGSCLLLLPQRAAWSLVAAIDLGAVAYAVHYFPTAAFISYYCVSVLNTALITFGLTRLAQLVVELHAMRSEMAQMAVTQERLRFARDLHDLLGYSLSSITLKSELTYRLVLKQPGRAQSELAGILEISRQALADVRAVASSYRAMSLAREADAAQSMLNEAEIDTSVDICCGPLPPALDTVLATTLREGVTNALRHSKMQRCRIAATEDEGRILLEVANDGAVGKARGVSARKGGSGLENLAARVAAFDGALSARVAEDGWFRLEVRVPRPPAGARVKARPAAGGGVGEHRDHDLAG
ncbi:MAG TPA: histidine kinase [Actinocrinis sp.]|nr:histidine kinase [Actinocrinis sp.]